MKFKYLLATSLAAGMLFSLNLNAEASTSIESANSVKFSDTVDISKIENLSDYMLAELAKDEGEVVSISEKFTTLNTRSQNAELGGLMPLAMPTSDFKLTTVAQRITEKGSSYDNFKFTVEGQWKVNPNWEFTDTIAVAWSDEFTLYQDYAYINGYSTDTSRAKVNAEKGVAYDVDLQLGKKEESILLIAKVYKNNSTGTANVVGEYGHVELAARDISVSFSGGSGGAEIGMSVGIVDNLNMAVPDYEDFTY